jgi:mono/diheme cytochrome c family protein
MRLKRLILCSSAIASFVSAATTSGLPVTFSKEVAPILQKNCQTCHGPGEAAPMSFLTYEQVRPWAKAIREAVLQHRMPPWHADPHYGTFRNNRSLSPAEIKWPESGPGIEPSYIT